LLAASSGDSVHNLGMREGVLLLVLVAAAGCVSSEVTPLGPARPARAVDCAVTLLTARKPDSPFVDIAYIGARCDMHDDCLIELHRLACVLGGDTLYGLQSTNDGNYVTATVAAREKSALFRPPVAAPAAGECTPLCSPGFACQASVCIPQCNPACEAGEVCNRHRTCEPAPHAAGP
jgi:hypothetical protein